MTETLTALGGLAGLVALLTVIVRWAMAHDGGARRELVRLIEQYRGDLAQLRTEFDEVRAQLVETERREGALREELTAHARALAEARQRITDLEAEGNHTREALVSEILAAERRRRVEPRGHGR